MNDVKENSFCGRCRTPHVKVVWFVGDYLCSNCVYRVLVDEWNRLDEVRQEAWGRVVRERFKNKVPSVSTTRWEIEVVNKDTGVTNIRERRGEGDNAKFVVIAKVFDQHPFYMLSHILGAALDMYEALKYAEPEICNHEYGHVEQFTSARRKMQSAIAKAEGRV